MGVILLILLGTKVTFSGLTGSFQLFIFCLIRCLRNGITCYFVMSV